MIALLKEVLPWYEEIESLENFTRFQLKIEVRPQSINGDVIEKLLDLIQEEDRVVVHISHHEEVLVSIRQYNQINEAMGELSAELMALGSNSVFTLSFEIEKAKRKTVYIYDFEIFFKFWGECEHDGLLKEISSWKKEFGCISLRTVEEKGWTLQTSVISLNGDCLPNRDGPNSWLGENCHFEMASQISLSPDDLNYECGNDAPLCPKLRQLKGVLSIIYISDISRLDSESIGIKIYGYRVIDLSIYFIEIHDEIIDTLFSLYEWCYSDHASLTDKLGIARNLLSIHLRDGLEDLSTDILSSAYSAHRTYLKDNLNKYLELRNTLLEELNWVSQKAGDIADSFVSAYYKSLVSFLTFFASIFVVRVMSGISRGAVFTIEATYIAFAFLAISIIILVFLKHDIRLEINRLKQKYSLAKRRYLDLLDEKDIQSIVGDDREFEYEIGHIKSRQTIYTAIWIISVVILSFSVYLCSPLKIDFSFLDTFC